MKIKLTSGQYGKAINTYDYNDFIDLTNDILETIQDVWNVGRKYNYVLTVKTDDCTVDFRKYENCIKVFNPVTNTEVFLCDAKKMSKNAWLAIWKYIIRNFAVPMTNEDLERENTNDFIDFENDAMCELNDAIENATETIKDAEYDIDRTDNNDLIAEAADRAYNALTTIKGAVNNFLKKMSDYTDCDFCVEDATGEHYIDTPCIMIDWADFDIADTFMDWLGYVLKGRENAEDLSNTLYNYIAC